MDLLHTFIDIVLHLDQHLAAWGAAYGLWIYGILFLVVFCETGLVVTPFLPGDSLLFAAGALAATGGTQLDLTLLTLASAAVLGDNLNYFIGRMAAPHLFKWEKSRFFNREGFARTQSYFARYGAKTLVMARFIPLVRTFAPFTAGVAHMRYPLFLTVSLCGGAFWVGSLTLAGYWLGNIPVIKSNIEFMVLGIIAISLLPVIITWIQSRRSK